MNGDSLLIVESVTKRYGETLAVDGVSLRVAAGEVYALVGANGAGKSTLIRMMTGLSEPDAGGVWVCGEEMARRPLAAKRRVGYLPEELYFYERLTGREYLRLVAGLKGADEGQTGTEMEFFELKAVESKWVGGYSLGMRKKLGLAAAFLGEPSVLVLDEPLNGLDVEMMRKLRLRVERERDAGRAFVVSSHVMSFVERVADRAGVMSAGRIVAEGSPSELRRLASMDDAPFEDVFFRLAK
ncbi:MAG: Cu-processing system ATP-binding protein [Acidobacteriota bacterium]|nr:Cu-processing system ATP-binding protein [Acidobacteriota bacterium]MDT7780283.1 Cu-processing system ATP-binding protein [Acidobacteriota bacterium]